MIYTVPIEKAIKSIDIVSNIDTGVGAIHVRSGQGIHFTGELPEDVYPFVYTGDSRGVRKWHGHNLQKHIIEAKGTENNVDALVSSHTDVRLLLVKKSQIYEYIKNNLNEGPQLFQLSKSYHIDEKDLAIFCSIHNRILEKEQVPDDEIFPLLLRITQNSIITEDTSETNYDLTQKAIGLMREHLKPSITIKELSDLLGVSIRTLELAFKKHFNLSAKCYYKRLLYLIIEEELRKRNPKETTISDILETYQIYDLSYFGKYFKDYFAIKPSDTGLDNKKENPLGWDEKMFLSFLGADI